MEAGRDFVSFVATDNLAGGRLAGAHLGELLGGEGQVVLLRYMVGSSSTTRREQGFLEAVGEAGSIEVLVDNRYAGPTAGEAKTESLNMIDTIEQADGVFCPNESATYGMLLALRKVAGERFAWRAQPYEFVTDIPAVDLLTGGPAVRQAVEAGAPLEEIAGGWRAGQRAFAEARAAAFLYD